MEWYSTAGSQFGEDMGAPADGGFALNVLLRSDNAAVYRTWHSDGRGTEQIDQAYRLVDLLPYGRQEDWQDVPDGWPQFPTYSRGQTSEDVAALYGDRATRSASS